MDAGLYVRIGHVDSELLSDFQNAIGVFLPSMKNENADGDQQRVDGEGDDSRCSPQTRPESRGKRQPTFAAIEKDSQRAGEHDAEEWDHPDENAERPGLERGMHRNALLHRASERGLPSRGKPILYGNLWRKIVLRGLWARGDFSVRNRNLHMDLRSAALRTERPAVFDRGPALLASMLHIFEASAQRSGEQGGG